MRFDLYSALGYFKFVRFQIHDFVNSTGDKDFLDRIGHALNIYHTQYYTDELTDTIFFVTQQKYAGVNTSSNSIYYLFMTFRVLASKQSKQARDDPIAMFLLR